MNFPMPRPRNPTRALLALVDTAKLPEPAKIWPCFAGRYEKRLRRAVMPLHLVRMDEQVRTMSVCSWTCYCESRAFCTDFSRS